VQDALVVTLRPGVAADEAALRDLMGEAIAYTGEVLPWGAPVLPSSTPVDAVRVAVDDEGVVGMYSVLVRRGAAGVEAELTDMLIASRAQNWAVDRLLVLDMRQQAALRDARGVTALTQPPMDNFFYGLGARALGLVAPSGDVGKPLVRVLLPV
jgi:hypothetical protein